MAFLKSISDGIFDFAYGNIVISALVEFFEILLSDAVVPVLNLPKNILIFFIDTEFKGLEGLLDFVCLIVAL